jgi:thiamine biosynthesis lipoprotein
MMTRAQPWLGTFVEITCDNDKAVNAGYAAIAEVHRALNFHDQTSELALANARAHINPVKLSKLMAAVVIRASFWAAMSEGSFDASGGNWRAVNLEGGLLSYAYPLALDLSGIAKGYAVDCAVAAMQIAGARAGLVNAGGDMRSFGETRWPVNLVNPGRAAVAKMALFNSALATSAARPDGSMQHLWAHDPGLVSATVEAPTAQDADALAKIVLGAGPLVDDCLAVSGARALIIHTDGRVSQR